MKDPERFISDMTERSGLSPDNVNTLTDALSDVLCKSCLQFDTVAVPSFGRFVPIKNEETIVTDHTTGGRLLLPPELVLTFTSSSSLRKRIVR